MSPGPSLTRRSLLQWLGSGTTLALGAGLLAACSDGDPGVSADASVPPPDAGSTGEGGAASDLGSGAFPFSPPGPDHHKVFGAWGERTVDPQQVSQLLASWKLRVDGLVDTPRTYTFADLLALPRVDMTVDFHCVEGWSIPDVPWNGLHLSSLWSAVKPKAAATHVTFHTWGDVYNASLPLKVALEPRTLLTYGIAGRTLPLKHGFPLRIVIPRLMGYKSAKYVYRLELSDRPVKGYWVLAGYDYDAEVPASRLRAGKY